MKRAFSFFFLFILLLAGGAFAKEWGRSELLSKEGISATPIYDYIDADIDSIVEIKLKTTRSYDECRFFFMPFEFQSFERGLSLPFNTGRGDRYGSCFLNMKTHPYWRGSIRQVLLSYPPGTEISYIKVQPANPYLIAIAAWQEFFYFRMPNLGTCFIIMPATLFGKPFNQFVYIGAIALFILSLPFWIWKGQWKKAGKGALVLVMAGWVILSLKFMYDNYRVVYRDYQDFFGKSLEQKHIQLTGGDYYQFLKWCGEKLKGEKYVELMVPSNVSWAPTDFLKMKGPYYLVPLIVKPQAKYVIVYQDIKPEGKFRNFAEFSREAYILERIK
ncbi:hypothetical protein A2276_05525 [candidate division WOR-1 bacterium RIFOXYA12_FULL_43_27]|uniref:Uncharacterized protein n=1 Tax=candidate division WOR-1 bacterium RIFOXYC2_FULL_46_14 TaxID=1802587 RepID=A0A1F4U3V2_UNCSA|nr:MAG: hypothetical protein A2276_05525 [candidate division WOR-1 bacterium RIFOXYA12_FULL_43_27]OGC20126.1 MAG: hypothetical protein A2292_03530 [candidate division WOR-1 bacterium RIFOXYB2_FULL_46_45]OGC32137.1 MAG: hypothetical protein A2232_07920 [candidate division WOR-1 bacterium RIFOXYA2_FULL_46_56]OGC39537.1 MAG: hypothetical protein A2438_08285 [candidate division WOR-1 bacterium RIFOXYC2_FULL_46_14]